MDIIDFLNNEDKYRLMDAKVPRGILLYGPPGTGKTLIAKAIAGEAKATFIYASGSEFVEKYVGVGAKRVRTIFERARKEAPYLLTSWKKYRHPFPKGCTATKWRISTQLRTP
jgi:cell division protease FtsH